MNERRIRTQIMLHWRFFGALLHNINIIASDQIPTAAINKVGTLLYNPSFMDNYTEKEQLFIICHEILHAAFGHVFRIFQMRQELWQVGNIAGDYLVNEVLVAFGLPMPKGLLYNKNYNVDKYTLEELVKELLKNAQPQQCSVIGFDCKNDGEAKGTEAEKKFEQKMKQALIIATEMAKKQGNLPGSLERACQDLITPKQNWRRELQDWFNVKIRTERSWHRPNRRFIPHNHYLPTKSSYGCGHIGIGVDVSGSIGQSDLDIFSSELNYIFSTCNPQKISVVYFDSDIRKTEEYNELPIKLTTCGGGGTEFPACFNKFESLDDPIQGMVFMSDGYGTWPKEPTFPTVMLSTTRVEMPFGKTLYVDMTNEK